MLDAGCGLDQGATFSDAATQSLILSRKHRSVAGERTSSQIGLMRCSAKAIDEAAAQLAVGRRRASSPCPPAGVAIALSGGDRDNIGDVVDVGQGFAREGFGEKDEPPAFHEVELGGADGNEGVLHPLVVGQPILDECTQLAGQIVGEEVQLVLQIRVVESLEKRTAGARVALGSRLGQHLTACDLDDALLHC